MSTTFILAPPLNSIFGNSRFCSLKKIQQKVKQIKADLLPVISEKWGQKNEGEEVHYLSPLSKRCHKWIKHHHKKSVN